MFIVSMETKGYKTNIVIDQSLALQCVSVLPQAMPSGVIRDICRNGDREVLVF